MQSSIVIVAAFTLVALSGCTTSRIPTTATTLEPKIRAKIERGVIEPGFTPEMVYLALGKPSLPKENIVDATQNGTWVYQNFNGNDRDTVRAGYRRRVIFDPTKRGEVVVTERFDPKAFPTLEPHSLHVTFHDGRVVEIQRVAAL